MIDKNKLRPCPFCGGKDFTINLSISNGKTVSEYADIASIGCRTCDAEIRNVIMVSEHFVPVEGGLYKKVPTKYAEEVLVEAWNRRAE